MHLISLCVFKVAIIENFTSIIISDNVKCVSGSDEPTENYQLNLQLPAALQSFAGSFSSLFSCPAKVHDWKSFTLQWHSHAHRQKTGPGNIIFSLLRWCLLRYRGEEKGGVSMGDMNTCLRPAGGLWGVHEGGSTGGKEERGERWAGRLYSSYCM